MLIIFAIGAIFWIIFHFREKFGVGTDKGTAMFGLCLLLALVLSFMLSYSILEKIGSHLPVYWKTINKKSFLDGKIVIFEERPEFFKWHYYLIGVPNKDGLKFREVCKIETKR